MIQIHGVITDPAGKPVPRALIELRALSTTGEVLMGSVLSFKCDSQGAYDFLLAVGNYDAYAQNDRCGDMNYLGIAMITVDSCNGSLNSKLVDGGLELTPPLLERAVGAMARSEAAAEVTARDRLQTGSDVVAVEQARQIVIEHASIASASATMASSKAGDAATSAGASAWSASCAQKWADNPVDVEVEAGKYSALHHATTAGTSALMSASSATTAAASSVTASVKAQEAKVIKELVLEVESTVQGMRDAVVAKTTQAQAAADTACSKASQTAQDEASASSSAQRASVSEGMAEAWAQNPEGSDINGRPGEFSALHWAMKAQQAAQVVTSQLVWAGPWNAAAGSPPTPVGGHGVPFYRISHPGDIASISYLPGDYLHWDPAVASWFKIDGTDAVISVNGMSGGVVLSAADVGARPVSWVPGWGDITNKPVTMPPSLHSHSWSELVDIPAHASRWPSYEEVTGKPEQVARWSGEVPQLNWWLSPTVLRFMDGRHLWAAVNGGTPPNQYPNVSEMRNWRFVVRIYVGAPTQNVYSHMYSFTVDGYWVTNTVTVIANPVSFFGHTATNMAAMKIQMVPSTENQGCPYFELHFQGGNLQSATDLDIHLYICAEKIWG